MGLDEMQRQAVRSMPKDSKSTMLSQHLQQTHQLSPHSPHSGSSLDKKSAEHYVRELVELSRQGPGNPFCVIK